MAFWKVPHDLDYEPDTATEPEVVVQRDASMRRWEINIYLPKIRPLQLLVNEHGLDLVRFEADGSLTGVFQERRDV